MKLLKNNWKWFVTTILSVFAVIIPTYYSTFNNKLDLRYEILSSYQIVSLADNETSYISVLYKDKKINNPYISEIKIINTGNTPITSAMYENNILINFGEKSKLLESKITKKSPDGIATKISQNHNSIELSPSLLNPDDFIIIRAITSEIEPTITLSARVAGLRSFMPIEKENKAQKYITVTIYFILAVFFSTGYAIASTLHIQRDRESKKIQSPSKSLLFLGICLMVSMTLTASKLLEYFDLSIWAYMGAIIAIIALGEFCMRIFNLHTHKEHDAPN